MTEYDEIFQRSEMPTSFKKVKCTEWQKWNSLNNKTKSQINFGSYLYKNEKGDEKYKTSIGGLISIFCQTFYCYFFYFFLIQLITNSNNAVSQNDLFVNW